MMWLRKSKKGFTLVELMVVVAIIGILALLGLRLFLMQQIRAKNAIVKANTATCHTIIQGNLADTDYSTAAGIGNGTGEALEVAAVMDIRDQFEAYLPTTGGTNAERPAGMKNPHLTLATDLVVVPAAGADGASAWLAAALTSFADETTYGGVALVGYDTVIGNRFYIVGLDNDAEQLGEVYIAQK